MSPLDGDQLRALLHDAVDDLRPSPDGYDRIKSGIARRERWRIPAFAAGAAALAGIAALAFVLVQPHGSTQLVEPATPISSSIGPKSVVGTATSDRATPTGTATASPGTQPGGRHGSRTGSTTGPHATAPANPTPNPTASGARGPDAGSPGGTRAKDGDIDGDGKADTVTFSAVGLVAKLSKQGLQISLTLPSLNLTEPPYTITDIDDDGHGEIVFQESGSSSTAKYGIIRMASDGSLVALSGAPLPLAAGSSSSHGDGFTCSGGIISIRSGSSDDGTTYTVTTTNWQLSGTTFRKVGSPTTATWDSSSAAISPFRAACGTLGR